MTREPLWPAAAIAWTLASAILILATARSIANLWFSDPDDIMRLLEVRDWIAGQSWWDVDQHRLGGGAFSMHWSRLVDLPLAAVIAPLDPLIGSANATRVAITLVPLLTLGCALVLAAITTRRLAGIEPARVALLLVPLSVPLLYQIRPMRIDHHGWQIVLAMAAAAALLSAPGRRSGAWLGLALAALVTVSLEGLPVAVAILGVGGLAWAVDPTRRVQLLAALWTMLVSLAVLHLATRGPGVFAPACDAVSPAWLAGLAAATLVATAALFVLQRAGPALRIAGLAGAAVAGLVALVALAPDCLRGPFATLDPLVRSVWFENVSEGLPIWRQSAVVAAMTIGFPLFGLVGTLLARRQAEGDARFRWTMMLAVAAGALLLSVFVARAGATANALAIPGGGWLLYALLSRARAIGPIVPRTLATAAALIAAAPGLLAGALFGFPGTTGAAAMASSGSPGRSQCTRGHRMADLAQLPPSIMFAPLDLTPDILAASSHRAIASGYHRNAAAIHRVLAAFLGTPEAAYAAIRASGAAYVVGCPGINESELYKALAPNGFWARLERGERFDWLETVPIPGSPVLVWKVVG